MKIFKSLLLVSMLFFVSQNSFSAFVLPEAKTDTKAVVKPKSNHKFSAEQLAAMRQLVKLTPTEYGKMRGKKLSFVEKIEFKAVQKKLKKQLSYYDGEDSEGFNLGGFALGFLLGLVGVLLAYIFSKDRNLRKWAWIGLGAYAVVIIVVLIIVASAN